jgi:hypothetical protein
MQRHELQQVVVSVIDSSKIKFILPKTVRKQNERYGIISQMKILDSAKLNGLRKQVQRDKMNEVLPLDHNHHIVILNPVHLLGQFLMKYINEN